MKILTLQKYVHITPVILACLLEITCHFVMSLLEIKTRLTCDIII